MNPMGLPHCNTFNNFSAHLDTCTGVTPKKSRLDVRAESELRTESELRKVFGILFLHAVKFIRHDRFTNEAKLTDFLREAMGELPEVNEPMIQKDPLFAMIVLILKNDPAENHWRDVAAETYIVQHPEDDRFEKAYVYLKTPHILLAHILICTKQWNCANPENKAFYDEQMAGLFHGTIAFDKGDRLSPEELAMIQQREGENPQFPIGNKVEKKEGYFEVKDWCSTPAMCATETRIEDLFITSRRAVQEHILASYINGLEETSAIVQKVYALPPGESAVVAIIGPYGAGKSRFVQQKFLKERPITVFSLNKLNELLMNPSSRPQDHHFEAMMLTSKLLKRLAEVPVLLTETAAIDEYRFNRLVDREFTSRNRIVIEEIATEKPSDAVDRFVIKEGVKTAANLSLMGLATTSANDALRFRAGRIENAKNHPKIHYTLYCSLTDTTGTPVFTEIAKAENGAVKVVKDREETFAHLVPELKS
jgi:hypothetical protein